MIKRVYSMSLADIEQSVFCEKKKPITYPKEYQTLEQKRQYVENVSFGGTCFELIAKLRELTEKGFLFRGQRNALWPIVSSGQREYVNRIKQGMQPLDFTDFLSQALQWAKKESHFLPACSEFPVRSLCDHEIWGWLQHYCYFTPFIDFSRDYRVALYMATTNTKRSSPDGWFSIYAIRKAEVSSRNEVIRLETILETQEALKDLDTVDKFAYKIWKDFPFCLVHKDGSLKPWDNSLGAKRIASQGGLFIYFSDPTMALEQYFYEENKGNEFDGEVDGPILQKMKCIDVPNTMIPSVQEFCNREGITADYLGFSDQHIDQDLKCIGERFQVL